MADEQDKSQQTEEASPKKIEDARKKGQVPNSKEPSTAITFLTLSLIVVTGLGSFLGNAMMEMMTFTCRENHTLKQQVKGYKHC